MFMADAAGASYASRHADPYSLMTLYSHNLYYVKSCMERIFKQTAKMLVTRFMSLLRNTRQKLTQVSYLASVSAS